MPVRTLETLLAIKAIGLFPGLRDSDRQIGIVLIEHFSRHTGRCDPSLDRLAEMTGFSVRTVIRSLKRLSTAGLFRIERHGGYSHRNSYEPVWSRFEAIRNAWQAKFGARSRSRGGRDVSPAMCQREAAASDTGVTQTYRSNLQNLTYGKGLSDKTPGPTVDRHGPVARPSSTSSSQAAQTAAERRWTDALTRAFGSDPDVYGTMIACIDDKVRFDATQAEMKRRGAGLALILQHLRNLTGESGR